MAKLTTSPISAFTQSAITTINQNMDDIEAAVENTLSRDGTTPNQMLADFDMNGNDILNVDNLDANVIVLDGQMLIPDAISAGTAAEILTAIKTVDGSGSGLDADLLDGQHGSYYTTSSNITNIPSGNISSTNIQSAINELDSEKQPLDSDLTAIAASTTTSYGRAFLTYNTAADARLAQIVPTYVTLAQLVALDTTKDAVAYCTDIGNEGWFKWVGTDQSARTINQSVTTTSINSSTDVLTKVAHGLSTGMGIVPGTAVNGLSTNTVYWVHKIDADTWTLHPTVEDAINNTNIFNLTGTTNFTLKQLVDPLQDVYVIPTGGQVDGSAGAWIRAQGSRSLNIGRARIHRFNDRVMIGLGATSTMMEHSGTMAQSGAGSWLLDELNSGGSQPASYLLVNAALASVPNYVTGPQYAIVGAARTPDGVTTQAAIGVAGYGSGHSTSGFSPAWGGYFEARKIAGSTSTAWGIEIDATNLNSTPTSTVVSPYTFNVTGNTSGLVIVSGGGNTGGTVYDADSALIISSNPTKFRTGLTFFSTALTQDATTNYQHAILLPSKARVEWYTSDGLGNYGFTLHSEVSNTAHQMFAIASDTGFAINNTGGKPIFSIGYVASSVNYLLFNPTPTGSSPQIQGQGDDTNIDVSVLGKGTGGVRLRDGAGTNKFQINTTGIGFFNTTPVAKATVGAALSTGGAETNTNLATRINELRTALINYGLAS